MANLMLSIMGAEFERSLLKERQREGIALAKHRGYKGRKKTLQPARAAELVKRAGNGIPKVFLAPDYGISRETISISTCAKVTRGTALTHAATLPETSTAS